MITVNELSTLVLIRYTVQVKKGEGCNGHGTNVASLAGGKLYGVAKGSTLHSVRVMDCRGHSSMSAVILATYYVIRQVQQKQQSSTKTNHQPVTIRTLQLDIEKGDNRGS